jgi:protein SCO1/2
MYTVTLNPERETPAVLRTYARRHGDEPGWTYLTGETVYIEMLRRAIGFAYADPVEDADRSNITSILRYGNEAEMRWAHATTLGNPAMIVHMILADFGPDPTDASARFNWYCKLPNG